MQTLQQLRSGELKGSTRLKLSCGLTTFPTEIYSLSDTLEILDLSQNQLSELPDDFGKLCNLKIAFFSDNQFTVFPEVLSQCPQLEMIGFKANQIAYVSETALPRTTRWLILTHNRLAALPASIGYCSRMQKLMLAGNRLTTLPDELANCRNLGLLRISANRLQQLPDWLWSMPKLSWLAFSGNPCHQPPVVSTVLPLISWSELEMISLLGEGASGIISKANWQQPGTLNLKEVAVKVFKGEVTSDGLPADEMDACIAAGEHPNLVKVIGKITGHPAAKQGLVFELIPPHYTNLGGPPSFASCTRDVFTIGTSFSLTAIVHIATGIAEVGAHLHQRGIMHGDLYAHNTLVNEAFHPLFGDFGAATLYNKQHTTLATALEQLEVSAFGCLLDDLMQHADGETIRHSAFGQLQKLRGDCLNEVVQKRPIFKDIVDALHALRANW